MRGKLLFYSVLCALVVASGAFLLGGGAEAQALPQGTDVVLGRTYPLASKVLGRNLNITIHVPDGYAASSMRYPALYDLNAFNSFTYNCGTVEFLARALVCPNMIVVGIPSLQNGYVPTIFEERTDTLAGADLTMRFFKEELIPFVDQNFRTNRFRMLYGHSVGGLFTMYALFNYPDLFTAYLAGSPWFQNNDQYWLKNIERFAKERSFDQKLLFMTVGKGEAQLTHDTYRELEKWMNGQPLAGLTWKSAWLEGDHSSMLGRNIYDGLFSLFDGWKIPDAVIREVDMDRLDAHLKAATAKWTSYGLDASAILPEGRLNGLGYDLLNRKEYEKAIGIFSYNIERFPKSFNAHDSLAEAYLTMGDRENAIKFYKLAVQLNPGDSDFAKRVLEGSKAKLRELGIEK